MLIDRLVYDGGLRRIMPRWPSHRSCLRRPRLSHSRRNTARNCCLGKSGGTWEMYSTTWPGARNAGLKRASDARPRNTRAVDLSESDVLVLMMIGYFQPVMRSDLTKFFGREISRDQISALRRADMITSGPRSPQPRAPYTYVTTPAFLLRFGLNTLCDLPDFEALEDAGPALQGQAPGGGYSGRCPRSDRGRSCG